MDEVFDFNELLFRIIRRWRFIFSFAVVLAALVSGYQTYSQLRSINASAISGVDNASRQRVEKLDNYVRESIRMKIDPYSEYTSTITFLVRSDTLDRDRTVDISMLYISLQNDDKLYEKIKDDVSISIDSDYFRELISWNASSTSFEVRIIGHTPGLTQKIAKSVTSYYAEQHQRISQYLGEHYLEPVSHGEYLVVNQAQENYQNNIRNALKKLESEIMAKSVEPVSTKTVIMKFGLYAVIGGVGGIGISVLLLLFLDSVRMEALSDKDISKKYNLRFLGSVSNGGSRNA